MKNILAASFEFSMVKTENINNTSTNYSNQESSKESWVYDKIIYKEPIKSNIDSTIHSNYINSKEKYEEVKKYLLNNEVRLLI